jgi:RNase P protein component
LLREAFRLHLEELPHGLDLIAIPRGGVKPGLDWLSQSLVQLAHRAVARPKRDAR